MAILYCAAIHAWSCIAWTYHVPTHIIHPGSSWREATNWVYILPSEVMNNLVIMEARNIHQNKQINKESSIGKLNQHMTNKHPLHQSQGDDNFSASWPISHFLWPTPTPFPKFRSFHHSGQVSSPFTILEKCSMCVWSIQTRQHEFMESMTMIHRF